MQMNRRTFLGGAVLAAAGCTTGRPRPKLLKAGDRLNMDAEGGVRWCVVASEADRTSTRTVREGLAYLRGLGRS